MKFLMSLFSFSVEPFLKTSTCFSASATFSYLSVSGSVFPFWLLKIHFIPTFYWHCPIFLLLKAQHWLQERSECKQKVWKSEEQKNRSLNEVEPITLWKLQRMCHPIMSALVCTVQPLNVRNISAFTFLKSSSSFGYIHSWNLFPVSWPCLH